MITQSGWNPTTAVGIPPLRLAPHRIKLVSHTLLAVHCSLAQTSKNTKKMITQSGWNPTTAVGIPPLRLASHRIKLVSHILLAVHCSLAQTSKTQKNDHTKWLESHHCGWHPTAAVGIPPHKTCITHTFCCTL